MNNNEPKLARTLQTMKAVNPNTGEVTTIRAGALVDVTKGTSLMGWKINLYGFKTLASEYELEFIGE